MKYKFFGTAAAEAIPAFYCNCETCKKARETGGRNFMSRSQSLIDDKILIDFPADTFLHMKEGLDLRNIKTYLITHSHIDHFSPTDLVHNSAPSARGCDVKEVDIYVGEDGCKKLKELEKNFPGKLSAFKIHEIKPFEPFEAEGYKITPLKADHDPASSPVIFIIEKDGKALLHGNDTAYFPKETREYLKENPIYLDFAALDCTSGNLEPENNETSTYHMNYATVLHTVSDLRKIGMIDDKTKIVINHFSHNCGLTYDGLCELAKKDNFEVSYDGLEIEF